MNEYHLHLVGLRTVLRTPHDITVSARLRPFLCPPSPDTDCTITLQSSPVLPAISDGGTWHGPEYHDTDGGVARIFHCAAPHTPPFAVTRLMENGHIEIAVLPSYMSYFTGSEGIFNRIGIETLLLQHHGLLLHASLIQYAGQAIAFVGPSGVGKSTQAALWHDCLGAEILNGDRAALRRTATGWMAYGSPYAGTSGIYKNSGAPLTAVVVLQQASENHLCRLNAAEAFRHLYPEASVHHWDKAFVAQATDLCLHLLTDVPVYRLDCRPDADAVHLTKKGLGL